MPPARNPRPQARTVARLAAVQALYQRDMKQAAGEEIGVPRLLAEFHAHRLGEAIEDIAIADPEVRLFDDLVQGVVARQEEIDTLIAERLTEGWSLAKLDRTLLQILRAGSYELIARPDVPTATVIAEYVDLADAFLAKSEVRFANALLDAIARERRG